MSLLCLASTISNSLAHTSSELISLVESLITIVAIVAGGIWTYLLFIRNRQRWPRARIGMAASHFRAGSSHHILHVDLAIANVGQVLLEVDSLSTTISQMLPLPKEIAVAVKRREDPVPDGFSEIQWPVVITRAVELGDSRCEIEPGESQTLQFDFMLDSRIKLVEIYSYVLNQKKRERNLAWDLSRLYDFSIGSLVVAE
jgi:hypothetical protein